LVENGQQYKKKHTPFSSETPDKASSEEKKPQTWIQGKSVQQKNQELHKIIW